MKKEVIRLGVVGLGCRGAWHLDYLLSLPDVRITAVCDKYSDRAEAGAEVVKKVSDAPLCTTDYREVIASPEVDAVLIFTDWELHIPIAIAAMEAGKAVASEVAGAYSLNDCFRLVEVWERTRVPFMFLENCCYNKEELLATAMTRDGKFGKIVHCSGAYGHDLRNEIAFGKENRHYRLRNYLNRNTENYPTHELGPIAKLMNINRGNRMVSLVSVASKSFGMKDYISKNADKVDPALHSAEFQQGDIVNTVITCADGSTILLTLDTTLPRSYNRAFTVRGTDGMYEMATHSVFFDGDEEDFDTYAYYKKVLGNATSYEKDYLPEEWANITPEELAAGHGGMDGVMWRSFLDALKNGEEMPIDVYDAAAWMAITPLCEQSIAQGGAPVEIPDFTCGQWLMREPKDVLNLPKAK